MSYSLGEKEEDGTGASGAIEDLLDGRTLCPQNTKAHSAQ